MSDFPKYEREDKLSTKLSEVDIIAIRKGLKAGVSKAAMGREIGVSNGVVAYWCKTPEERAEINRKRNGRKRTYNPASHRKYLTRKRASDPEGIRKYRRELNARLKAEKPEQYRKRDREWRQRKRKAELAQILARREK
jgi:hypothetical protein